MNEPAFSLVYLTYRPGGLDLLAQSLLSQPHNYELIVIDDFPGRVERGLATAYLHAHNLPLTFHCTPKTKAYPNTPVNLANAMNTGALLARTPWVVFLHDYTVLMPRVLCDVAELTRIHAGQDVIVSGMAEIYRTRKPQQASDISVWMKPKPLVRRLKGKPEQWIPEEFENFFCMVPIRFFEQTNGIDERADGHISWSVLCMAEQARLLNYKMVVNRKMRVRMVDHHDWGGGLWHAQNIRTGLPAGTPAMFFAPTWRKRSENPYDFVTERQWIVRSTSP